MELATPPPAARPPVAWYSWWLLPLGLGSGTVAAAVTASGSTGVAAAVAGATATTACAVCVQLLVRSRRHLRRSAGEFRAEQAEATRRWQGHVTALEQQLRAEAARREAERTEETAAHERRLAEHDRLLLEGLEAQRSAVALLAREQLPAALARLREGEAIDDILPDLAPETDGSDAEAAALRTELRTVLRTSLIAVEEELNRSTAAEHAVISIGNRIHVLTSKLRGRLHELQGEHGRLPRVAQGLMELDQEIGPADCLAASIGVLGGSDRPGRQWQEPQRLLSVVRGGIGRIKDFQRVQVRYLPELGVDGGLVDHLTLIFAHLLDNAARYSPPSEPVLVSGREVPNGVGIEIQDAGKGLSEEKKREAEQALAGAATGPGLGGVSEDANLGLRVVGSLARRYGIRVTFADSPWLGTSVVVVVPHKYFTPLASAPAAPERPRPATAEPEPEPALAPAQGADPDYTGIAPRPASVADTTPGGLPRRRSRRTAAEDRTRPAAPEQDAASAVPPDASFAGLAAFATAGRDVPLPRTDGAPQTTEPTTRETHGDPEGGAPAADEPTVQHTRESDQSS